MAFVVLAFVVLLLQIRIGMFDMDAARFLDLLPYGAYLLAGVFLAGRILRVLWGTRESDWSLEFLYTWVWGLIVEAVLWAAAFATGLSPQLLFGIFVGCSLLALRSRSVEILSMPRVQLSDAIGVAASFLGLYFWISYRFANVPAVDEQIRTWGGFSDYQDLLFHWAYAAQFKNALFGELPMVSGLPLAYVFTANLHMGLASSVSGASLELILLRGLPLAVNFVTCIGLNAIAVQIARQKYAGVLAVAAFYLANSLSGIWQPDSPDFFGNVLRFALAFSPNFLFSLPVFLVAFHLIATICVDPAAVTGRRRLWLALAATLLFGALTKATFAGVVVMGVLPAAALAYRSSPGTAKSLALCGGLGLVLFLVAYPFVSSDYDATSILSVAPLHFFSEMQAYQGVLEKWPGAESVAWAWFWLWVPFAAFSFMPILASTLGQCVMQMKRFAHQRMHLLLAGMVVVPLVFTCLVQRTAGTFYLQGYSVMLAAVWFAVVCCQAAPEGTTGRLDLFWKSVHAVCFLAASIAGVRSIQSAPVNMGYLTERYDERPLLSGDDVETLRFIAGHARPSDVIASNFHEAPFRETTISRFWYQSAVGERRHFVEGSGLFGPGPYGGFADEIHRRLELLGRVFSGDTAIATDLKRRYGVRYLVDHHSWAQASGRRSNQLPPQWVVFANQGSRVYSIP